MAPSTLAGTRVSSTKVGRALTSWSTVGNRGTSGTATRGAPLQSGPGGQLLRSQLPEQSLPQSQHRSPRSATAALTRDGRPVQASINATSVSVRSMPRRAAIEWLTWAGNS